VRSGLSMEKLAGVQVSVTNGTLTPYRRRRRFEQGGSKVDEGGG